MLNSLHTYFEILHISHHFRKQLLDLNQNTNKPSSPELEANKAPKTPVKTTNKSPKEKTELYLTSSMGKEVGEVEDSSNSRETSLMVTVCSQCQGNLRVELQDSNDRS